MQYHTNSATFELPAQLKDKSMHMFVMRDDGPSEFSVVITHADVPAEESLADFGDRLHKELGRALPRLPTAWPERLPGRRLASDRTGL
ncbi:DcrB-related protein [Massilia eburnea]|uniref:DcrB-related protein n=1 Tax=Massilia eburnea TaxID=1776165 RepID=UPI003D6C67D4